jgi:two-component system cell cycle sensor histidine kinase/response regulator CckA
VSVEIANAVPTVLVVDDEHILRQMMTRALEQQGYRVIAAEDGESAWELLQAGARVHAVVTDVAMPGMTGLELAAKVATLPNAPPVILISGYRHDTSLEYPFLPKPFGPTQLGEIVHRLLGGVTPGSLVH